MRRGPSWASPPEAREVRLDETWAFVGEEQKDCDPNDPDDDHRGDYRDHAAFDPGHKPVLAAVPGARTEEGARATVAEAARRVGCDPPPLVTGDESPAYATAIEE